jgi:benzodiazapine receptor
MDQTWINYSPIIVVALIVILGFAVKSNTEWYKSLNKASFNPPSWIFPVAWTILYVLIAIAWVRGNLFAPSTETKELITFLFTLNIILNLSWTFIFFGQHQILYALLVIVAMIITTCILIWLLAFDTVSLVFMVIYVAWLVFALILNFVVWTKNKHIEKTPQRKNLMWMP